MTLKELRIAIFGYTDSERVQIMIKTERAGRETARDLQRQHDLITCGTEYHCDGRINEEKTERNKSYLLKKYRHVA